MTDHTVLPVPEFEHPDRHAVDAALERVLRAAVSGRFELLDPWPYPPGPAGPVRLADGSAAHGAYVHDGDGDLVLLVANNGWPIDIRRCPGPNPGRMPLLNPVNCWVSQQETLVGTHGSMEVVPPDAAAIDRVIARDKPLALATSVDGREVEAWQALAEAHGLGCRVEEYVFRDCGGERVWFVSVARTERFDELVDLAAMREYYERALPPAGGRHLVHRVLESLSSIAASSPADYLDRSDALVMAPFADDEPHGCPTEVTGAVLGYWPPTTARMLLSVVDGVYVEPEPEVDLRGYDTVRYALTGDM